MDVIRSGTDARDIDQQPMREYDMKAYIFFVMFCLFGGFLTMKLFIGVIIDNFNMLKSHVSVTLDWFINLTLSIKVNIYRPRLLTVRRKFIRSFDEP